MNKPVSFCRTLLLTVVAAHSDVEQKLQVAYVDSKEAELAGSNLILYSD